ncbi:MAG: efflux RND transporter periplasmic adaptor subunit [Vicinamibacterales bacterium]
MRLRLLGLSGSLIAIAVGGAACKGEEIVSARRDTAAPVVVAVAEVRGADEPVTVEATGTFVAIEDSEVAPEASGRIVETLVDVGQSVRRGQPIARIEDASLRLRRDEARAAVARAEASVRLAESENQLAATTARRYAALLASGHVSKTLADEAMTQAETSIQAVATARATLAQTQAQLALAERAVADVVVTAPFDGAVSARHVSPGEYVQPSTPVVTLVKVDPLRLQLSIPAVQASQVHLGQRVDSTVDAYPGQTFSGAITAVNPVIAEESRSFLAEVSVPNPDRLLKPGMFAVAAIDQGRTTRSLLVPRDAVVEDINTNSWRVFVVDEQRRARLRVVQLAARQSDDVMRLRAGVEEGERVATSNLGSLYDTAPVVIQTEMAEDGPTGSD